MNDLADHLAIVSSTSQEWNRLVEELRKWAATCIKRLNGGTKRFSNNKWTPFCVALEAKLDSLLGPSFMQSEEI
jgi:hypothetical protein